MKKFSLLLLTLTVCFFTACHKDIWAELENLDHRVTKLEELCKEMNTNITSLQTIVDVLQANDYISGIVEIKKNDEVIGYTITFGKHDPITIYHGQDGKDGVDGKDGQDGSANAPVIGVAQDTDGVYYWTLNGEWLLDDNGNKLPVSGKDGQNGSNGKDGKDGVTPQLKIEEGYWYISYDNGATWTESGKATGEDGKDGVDGENGKDGQNGADGKDGQDGDSMFQSVTQDENYVYFTLADGTVIKIAKGNDSSKNRIEGQLNGIFSVSKYDKVNFSQGNLLYNPALDVWKFAEMQYDCYNQDNTIASTDSVWMDLFIWGCTGYNKHTPFTYYSYEFPNFQTAALKIENFDWGVFCSISNGGNQRNQWRTLTTEEWLYVINERKNAEKLHADAIVNDIKGLILFPDTSTITINNQNILVSGVSYSVDTWQVLERQGCVFLPYDKYWTSTPYLRNAGSNYITIDGYYINLTTGQTNVRPTNGPLEEKNHVRLVRNICEK